MQDSAVPALADAAAAWVVTLLERAISADVRNFEVIACNVVAATWDVAAAVQVLNGLLSLVQNQNSQKIFQFPRSSPKKSTIFLNPRE